MSENNERALAAPVASHMIEADPYLVAFSLDNPRKRRGLDIDSLNALAASIKTQGLAQPILVRPLPGSRAADTFADREEGRPLPTFELVCGERRLRASRLAELATIPMLVRDLTDEAALELQLVENIEREDLDPMEEAEGFELLRTKLGYSVEQIAERIGRGKGTSYVYKTMKLLALTPESREAMYDGHLGRSTGLLVARYPAEQQAEVVAYIKNLAVNGEPAPFREVAPKLHQRFNLELAAAVWDLKDALLVPTVGACATCSKRTGVNPDLFGDDANRPDSCTDAQCFAGKREAHIARVKAQAQKDGFKVIDGDEAQQAVVSPHASWLRGYERLDAIAYTDKGNDDQVRVVTFEDALRAMGKKAPKPRILIHPHTGEAIKVITSELADKLRPQEPEDDDDRPASRWPFNQADDRPEDERALGDYRVRRAVTMRIFDAVRNRDRTDAEVLLMAKALFAAAGDGYCRLVATYMNWDADLDGVNYEQIEDVVNAKLDALPPAEVAAVASMAAIEVAIDTLGERDEQALQLAKAYGIDVLAVRDKVAEDLERQAGQPGESLVEGAERIAAEAGVGAGEEELGDAAAPTEIAPYTGARVRIKDDLRGPGGKFRKISGREGVLLSRAQDDWMFKADGSKEKTRVAPDEFVVLAAKTDDTAEAEKSALPKDWKPAPNAAWPFPIESEASHE